MVGLEGPQCWLCALLIQRLLLEKEFEKGWGLRKREGFEETTLARAAGGTREVGSGVVVWRSVGDDGDVVREMWELRMEQGLYVCHPDCDTSR